MLLNTTHLKAEINIENVVATATLNQVLSLKKISKKFPAAKYNPDRFPAVVIRLNSPSSVMLVFRTGKIVCTGTQSELAAKKILHKFINNLGDQANTRQETIQVRIVNVVASCNLHNKIHLEQAARILPKSMYEPEQFPGIIHRLHYPKTVVLIFASGKLVCAGAKSVQDIHLSVSTIRIELERKRLLAHQTAT